MADDGVSAYGILQDAVTASLLPSAEYEDVTWVTHGTVHQLRRVVGLVRAWQVGVPALHFQSLAKVFLGRILASECSAVGCTGIGSLEEKKGFSRAKTQSPDKLADEVEDKNHTNL